MFDWTILDQFLNNSSYMMDKNFCKINKKIATFFRIVFKFKNVSEVLTNVTILKENHLI